MMIMMAWPTPIHLSFISVSTSSFNFIPPYFLRPGPTGPGLSLRVWVVALGLCSAALHCLGEAGGLCFKGLQALQEKSHLQGYIQVDVLRYRLEVGLVLVEQDERVQVLDFRQRWRRPSLHVGRLTAPAVVGLGVVDQ